MSTPSNETSMIRRTLIAVGTMLGASALFVTACMLIVVAVIDRAVPPKSDARNAADVAETTPAERVNEPPRRGATPRSTSSDTRS